MAIGKCNNGTNDRNMFLHEIQVKFVGRQATWKYTVGSVPQPKRRKRKKKEAMSQSLSLKTDFDGHGRLYMTVHANPAICRLRSRNADSNTESRHASYHWTSVSYCRNQCCRPETVHGSANDIGMRLSKQSKDLLQKRIDSSLHCVHRLISTNAVHYWLIRSRGRGLRWLMKMESNICPII